MSAAFANHRPNRTDLSACDDIGGSRELQSQDSQISIGNNGHTANTIESSGASQGPQVSIVGPGNDDSDGTNSTNGTSNIYQANLLNGARPRWDQRPLAPSTSGGGLTLSHMESTDYTESVYETVYEYDEDGVAIPTQDKKKKKMGSPSVYSYNSARDLSQFVKDSFGR